MPSSKAVRRSKREKSPKIKPEAGASTSTTSTSGSKSPNENVPLNSTIVTSSKLSPSSHYTATRSGSAESHGNPTPTSSKGSGKRPDNNYDDVGEATHESSSGSIVSPPPKKRWKKTAPPANARTTNAEEGNPKGGEGNAENEIGGNNHNTSDAVRGLLSLPTSPAPETPVSLRASLSSFTPGSAAKTSLFRGMTPLTSNAANAHNNGNLDMFGGLVFSPGALADLGLEPGSTPVKANGKGGTNDGGFEAFITELSPLPSHHNIMQSQSSYLSHVSSYPSSPHSIGANLLAAPHLQSPPFLSSPDTIKKRRLMSPTWISVQLGNGDENENFKRVNEEMRKDITRISTGNMKVGKVVDVREIESRRSNPKKKGGSGPPRVINSINMHQQTAHLNPANYPPHPNFSHPNSNNAGSDANGQRLKKKIVCNCKKSKCLKLYCECFTALEYCDGCNCIECRNTTEHESLRMEAIKATKAKNANAFRQKISSGSIVNGSHAMGCRCKKSFCLKKYCECYEAGVFCGEKCRCNQCANYIGSHKLIERRKKIKDFQGVQKAEAAASSHFKPPVQTIAPPPPPPITTAAMPIASTDAMSPTPLELAAVAKLAAEGMGDIGNLTNLNEELTQEATDEFADAASTAALAAQISSSSETPSNSSSSSAVTNTSSAITTAKITSSSSSSLIASKIKTRSSKTSLHSNKKDPNDLVITQVFGTQKPTLQSSNIRIFKFLDNNDLFNAGLVSKGFKDIAFDENLWSF
mmetsp:Transcript_21721/g.45253  ORF Transcript_21721/g.45253 Transcript_21721/m.45253 type:complete len:752 (+) Transcript_21721:203-2458(+)|eukprot:CAMPEP_0118642398 /NCGR_PEP_ID=MMETSP0785-20121206/5813_1 /TAXON_ID=91992 /ORGANISM="Bolidomonas pacifica, Strain CCMP 1866" /LENGTH=751 /DNA_ID=CAMNT_0006533945 /DNA_START=158 /DNA_END=2413 /DNA_ORIENTATION=+